MSCELCRPVGAYGVPLQYERSFRWKLGQFRYLCSVSNWNCCADRWDSCAMCVLYVTFSIWGVVLAAGTEASSEASAQVVGHF